MKFERDEKITWYLLTLICFSTILLFLYAVIDQAYNTAVIDQAHNTGVPQGVYLTLLSGLMPGYSL